MTTQHTARLDCGQRGSRSLPPSSLPWSRWLGGVFHTVGSSLTADRRGAVSTEYVIAVGTVGLVVAGALIAIGPQLIHGYDHARNVLGVPFP
jgi:hypothetical protein